MSKNRSENVEVRKIQKKSIVQAIDLLKEKNVNKKRNRLEKQLERETEVQNRIAQHCVSTPIGQKKKQTSITGFTKQLAILELTSYIKRQDWNHIQNLFPTLLGYDKDLEPLIWRCALIILLYNPASNSVALRQFLELCLGSRALDNSQILERLLLLQSDS